MHILLVWFSENKEWVLSGVGVAVIAFIFHVLKRIIQKATNRKPEDRGDTTSTKSQGNHWIVRWSGTVEIKRNDIYNSKQTASTQNFISDGILDAVKPTVTPNRSRGTQCASARRFQYKKNPLAAEMSLFCGTSRNRPIWGENPTKNRPGAAFWCDRLQTIRQTWYLHSKTPWCLRAS